MAKKHNLASQFVVLVPKVETVRQYFNSNLFNNLRIHSDFNAFFDLFQNWFNFNFTDWKYAANLLIADHYLIFESFFGHNFDANLKPHFIVD